MQTSQTANAGTRWFKDIKIIHRLGASFGLLLLLTVALWAAASRGLESQKIAFDDYTTSDNVEIQVRAFDADMLDCRKAEKNFLYRGGKDQDAADNRAAVARALDRLKSLRGRADLADVAAQAEDAETVFRAYARAFDDAVVITKKRGADNGGALSALRATGGELDRAVQQSNDGRLVVLWQNASLAEKEYVARGDKAQVQRFHEAMNALRAAIQTQVKGGDVARLASMASTYGDSFDAVVSVDAQLQAAEAALQAEGAKLETPVAKLLQWAEEHRKSAQATAAAKTEQVRGQMLTVLGVVVLASLVLAVAISRQLSRGMAVMVSAAQAIAKGDVREEQILRDFAGRDELGMLAEAFSQMISNLRDVLLNVKNGVTELAASASQIAATTKQAVTSATSQATSVAEISTTVEEISQTSRSAAEKAADVVRASEDAAGAGRRGAEAVAGAVSLMGVIKDRVNGVAQKILDLSERIGQIGEIVDSVNDLAEQSNLLAVNASIEAAKAGEQGRGFAVVAAEVRTLAEQSKQATQQIRKILAEIQKANETAVMATEEGNKCVDDGAQAVDASRAVIEELARVLEESSDKARQIAGASAQQSSGISQISQSMEIVAQVGKENIAGAKQVEAAVLNISALGTQLKNQTERYVL